MAKKQPAATVTELPGIKGPGVALLSIPEINRAINHYERKKEARCSASPDEIAAKNDLKAILHAKRSELPVNAQGVPFYRYDGVDYVLEEKLKRVKCDDGSEGGED